MSSTTVKVTFLLLSWFLLST